MNNILRKVRNSQLLSRVEVEEFVNSDIVVAIKFGGNAHKYSEEKDDYINSYKYLVKDNNGESFYIYSEEIL